MDAPPPQQHQLQIELQEREAEGIYANLVLIAHSNSEFVIDFARVTPGTPKARIHARIMMTPFHAKSFLEALTENVRKYEASYGKIDTTGGGVRANGIGFGGPTSTEIH